MHKDLLDIICCPVCKGDLELTVEEEDEEITVGNLYCEECDEEYPIQDGIPNLLPPKMRDA
ncbi:MAG: methytransferase partner Trm112 [Halobacteria archaeon]